MPRVNHRQLEAFRAVMIAGTVTAAAERLCISQPAVSRLLGDLEYATGLDLFKRERGRLLPTPEAQVLFEEVEKSFVSIDKIASVADELRGTHLGSLRIAAMPAMALTFIPEVISDFSRERPGVAMTLQVRSSQKVVEWVAGQQFDLGFTAIQVADPSVEQEVLVHSRLVCALPRGHALARRKTLKPEHLRGEIFVSLGNEQRVRFLVDEVFDRAGVGRERQVDTQLSYTACSFVAAGMGIALVDPITAIHYRSDAIEFRPFSPRVDFDYSVIYPALRPRSRLTDEFVGLVRKRLAALSKATSGLFEIGKPS